MKIAAIYVRKSVQTGKGDSIQNQIDLCKEYARKINILVDDSLIYCDEGYSGKNFNRPEFKRMINELNQNKFNMLICYRLDRISRSLNDFCTLNEILEDHNISFVSVKELFDTSTPIGKSMMYIASVFSQLERETIAERLTDNIAKLSRTGRWLGGVAPTGFKSTLVTYIDDDLSKRKVYKLMPIKSELHIVKILFNKFLDLKGLSALENYCIDKNLKSKNDLPFTKTTLKQILTNPVYCVADEKLYDYLISCGFSMSNEKSEFNGTKGVLLYNIDGEKIVSLAKHDGVIKSIKWIEVQNILLNNSKVPYRQGTSSVGLLSGLIKCSFCGSLMRVKHGRKNINGVSYYYVCTLKEKDKSKCYISNLNGTRIDMIICKKIQSFFIQKVFLHFLLEYLTLDVINFKKDEHHNHAISNINYKSELNLLYDNLDMLKYQLEINRESSSLKYIAYEINLLKERIDLVSKFNLDYSNSKETSKLSILKDNFHKQIVLNFDILSLSFEDKKSLLNHVLDHIIWDNTKLELHIK